MPPVHTEIINQYEEFEFCVYVVKIFFRRRRPKYVCNTDLRKGL